MIYTKELLKLGYALTELAVKGMATAVSNKIKEIKDEKVLRKYEVHMMKSLLNTEWMRGNGSYCTSV